MWRIEKSSKGAALCRRNCTRFFVPVAPLLDRETLWGRHSGIEAAPARTSNARDGLGDIKMQIATVVAYVTER